jgi:protein translocase SecG subunit
MNIVSQILPIIEILLGLILIGVVILQSKGTGMGSTFGGDMGFYGTKRGAEKMLFIFTIVVAVLFFVVSLIGILL